MLRIGPTVLVQYWAFADYSLLHDGKYELVGLNRVSTTRLHFCKQQFCRTSRQYFGSTKISHPKKHVSISTRTCRQHESNATHQNVVSQEDVGIALHSLEILIL